MNIHLITFAYKLSTEFLEDFAAADGPDVTWHIFEHSQFPSVVAACETLADRRNVNLYPYGHDRGLAVSLNEGIIAAQEDGADAIIMMCDDMLVGPGDIRRLAVASIKHPECAYIDGHCFVESVNYFAPSQLDCAALGLKAIDEIGYFDRNFWPMNFEDTDWKRRAHLMFFTHMTLSDTQITHRACNANAETPESLADRRAKFERTRDFYVKKWGGDQGEETFSRPFDDPMLDLKIGREDINDPYPGLGREDIEAGIVEKEKAK